MSIKATIHIGPVALTPGMINGDYVDVTVVGEGVWVEDGIVHIPVMLWEEMQAAMR